ncbi:acyl-CoA thioesterase [Mycolicibacterium lutetiense]|jgi:acyl-CoA thioesterase II|uniref:Acyl-CoA thioesterase n=1 Tax=Mycolicibacterium lutetiense TaxID=1641992 RepID=A0ABS5A1M7_9MYCO|nr:acyl-CoA thioesterase domain-containing protein [Mycolicibacterium lutetiense]MBP2455677.1 acyl-CoA thioesterase [Mycolicibacterium lutetiense]
MAALSWIAELLQFDRNGDDFCIREPRRGGTERLFGGLIAAQSLGAAGATVDDGKLPQSLHAYFVRGGRYDADVEFHVDRIRDGRAFATRHVTASQGGKVILEMIASFHHPEPGLEWSPDAPPKLEFDAAAPKPNVLDFGDKFDLRTMPSDDSEFAISPFWIRAQSEIEDDAMIRACTLTFMSDLGPVPSALPPTVPLRPDLGFAASLDHSIWFHRPFLPHGWHRYELQAANHNDSRGLTRGSLYDAAGTLIASVSQEALWRIPT